MSRHLDPAFVSTTLHRGKGIACFLGAGPDYGGDPTIRWVIVRMEEGAFLVRLYEAIDPGDPEFLDIVEFQSTDPEGDPIQEAAVETVEAALERACDWGADPARFVNESMIGDEYGDYLAKVPGKVRHPG